MSAEVRRGTLLSFDPSAWTALVMLDGSDVESQMQVGVWVQAQMMVADSEVAVLVFGVTDTDDGIVLGPYGAVGLQDLDSASAPTFAGLTDTGGLNVGTATGAVAGQVRSEITDAVTAAADSVAILNHRSSGTPAAGFGTQQILQMDDDTNVVQSGLRLRAAWVSAVHASFKSFFDLSAFDPSSARIVLRGESNGSVAMLGFLGAAAVARAAAYTQTYATATRTHANLTAANPPAGGTGAAAGAYDTSAHRDAMITSLTNLIADVTNLKQVVNSLIDDLQANGLIG